MGDASPPVLRLVDGQVDLRSGSIQRAEVSGTLTTRERELLLYLAERLDEVVSTEELNREVWKLAPTVTSRAVFHAAQRLRKKIEVDPKQPVHLLTVFGEGYRLVAAGAAEDVLEAAAAETLDPLVRPDRQLEQDFVAAAEEALVAGDVDRAARMAYAAGRCRYVPPVHLDLVERVLDEVTDPAWSCRLEVMRATMTPDALMRQRLLRSALAYAEAANSRELEAGTLVRLGGRAREMSAYEQAAAWFGRARELVESGRVSAGVEALLCKSEGALLRSRGDLLGARQSVERALAIEQREGAGWYAAWSHHELALIHIWMGEKERALHHFGRSVQEHLAAGEARGAVIARQNRAITLYELGRGREAEVELVEMDAAVRALKDLGTSSTHAVWLAQVHLDAGRYEEALSWAEEARVAVSAIGSGPTETMALGVSGLAHLHQGRVDLARARLDEALALADRIGHQQAMVECRYRLAAWEALAGDATAAEARFREAEAMPGDHRHGAAARAAREALGRV